MGQAGSRKRLLRGCVFAVFALLVVVLSLAAMGYLVLPRRGIFPVILVGVAMLNLAWWLRADLRLADPPGSGAARRWSRLLLAFYVVVMFAPLVGMMAGSLDWRRLPTAVVMWLQLWHMLIVLAVPVAAAVGACAWLISWMRRRRESAVAAPDEVNTSRRAFLQRAVVAAPIVVTGGFTGAGVWQLGRLTKRYYTVGPPGLPDRLKGLTITHLSDFHVGRLYQVEHFRRAVDDANRFHSDIVVITGDLVDHSNDVLPDVLEAMRGLRHRYGLYLCLGNHDLIDDGSAFARELREAGQTLLVDERRKLEIGGERLTLGGLMWSRRDRGTGLGLGHEEHATAAFGLARGERTDAFAIALAHHPHAFDATAARGVSLTLSGHTHGGQLMLTPPGWPDLGAGNLLFRYIRGFYAGNGVIGGAEPLSVSECIRSDKPILFINAGAGNWFPVRINAPAEIVQLRLV
jgi:predicted MPP superfamily phosphohydrolase